MPESPAAFEAGLLPAVTSTACGTVTLPPGGLTFGFLQLLGHSWLPVSIHLVLASRPLPSCLFLLSHAQDFISSLELP